jgi:hypothetical protein
VLLKVCSSNIGVEFLQPLPLEWKSSCCCHRTSHVCCVPCSVWYKHRDNLFLPTFAETTSLILVRAVNTAFESVLFTSIVYWMIGYTRTAGECNADDVTVLCMFGVLMCQLCWRATASACRLHMSTEAFSYVTWMFLLKDRLPSCDTPWNWQCITSAARLQTSWYSHEHPILPWLCMQAPTSRTC